MKISVPFDSWCKAYGIPPSTPEYRFHETRKWRFDQSWPEMKVALEVQGGVWNRGKHARPLGIIKDQEKLNFAQILGWIVLQCTPNDITSGYAATIIKEALRSRNAR